MFGFVWLTLRQAQEAIRLGRLDEARKLAQQPSVRNHRKGGELLRSLARAYAERGERALRRDEAEVAWPDLLLAEALETADKGIDRLRLALTNLGVAELRALLAAGDTARAEEAIVKLRHRRVHTSELGVLEEGLRGWLRARELASRGEFSQAVESATQASRLLGLNAHLEGYLTELRQRQQTFPDLLARLYEAAGAERWREVVELSEQVLSAAAQHGEARALRSRAWKALSPLTITQAPPAAEVENPPSEPLPPRFFLWIDGVGGYMVCLGNRLTFGQALADARVDVPLVADVSRLHATLTRDGEGYVLEAVRPIQVNAETVSRGLLQSGDRVTLGASCQFLFRLPVPGNMTARLELVSGHRLPTSVDAVLLMAETLVIGADAQAHVSVPDMKRGLVLFRHRDGLGLRHAGEMRINGQKSNGRMILPPSAVISGDDIGFAIEPAT